MGKKFWDKVGKCSHKNLSVSYYVNLSCATPYCSGEEVRCLDCGVYISKCGCGYCNGMSGWPEAQWKAYYKKKENNKDKRKQPELVIYNRVLNQKEIELLYKLKVQPDYCLNKNEIKLLKKINKSKKM